VQDRGRLRPLSTAALDLDTRLGELAAQGLVRLPIRKKSRKIRRVEVPGPPLSQVVIEDREDRF